MPLLIAPINVTLKVIKIFLTDKTKKRLESLGITIGTTFSLIQTTKSGVIILLHEGRLALDKDIASKILVATI